MDAIGWLVDIALYFVVTVGAVVAVISHVDQKVAALGASPWRMRAPKLAAAAGPLLFIGALATLFTGADWLTTADLIASVAAPWIAAVPTPVGRIGQPHDVAEAVLFLAGNGFTTGTVLECTGGATLATGR